METTGIAIIVIAILVVGAGIVWAVRQALHQMAERMKSDQGLQMLNQNIVGMQQRIDETTRSLNDRLDNAARVIMGVSKGLGEMSEMGNSMRELRDIFSSPKRRGNLGEQVLRDMLEQYIPQQQFAMQHKFQGGDIVDAIVKTDKGIIPIDAKFPLENFQKYLNEVDGAVRDAALNEFMKDVKKHITKIATKYILPAEGTIDFAVMYVPSEAVYYEIIRLSDDLPSFAYDKRVFIVSPNSFYYFMKIIMVGMEGRKVEAAARQILDLLRGIKQDSVRFGDTLGVLNTHIGNAKNAMDRVNNDFMKLSGKIEHVGLLKASGAAETSLPDSGVDRGL